MSTLTADTSVVEAVRKQLLIDGAWVPSKSGRTLPVENPATGEALCEVADAGAEDAEAALAAADRHRREWAARAPRERGEILRRAYEAIVARTDDLALLMTLEMGKTLPESRAEVAYAADFFRWFAEEAVRIEGGYSVAPTGGGRLLTMRQPVGTCLLITPWNFPLAMGARKIAPAVAAGCTMVLKPAKQTPLSSFALAEILEQAGLPDGVLNVICSSSSGSIIEPLIRDPRVRKISFTGSTEVGRLLVEQSSTQLLRSSMELGGNGPFLVFADADLDAAVEGAVLAKIRNGGESCTAANRFLVDHEIEREFSRRFKERMEGLRVGPGYEDGTDLGPLIDEAQIATVEELVGDARDRGAEVSTGGSRVPGPGHFFAPTILRSVPADARILREEVFGPVAPIVTFADEAEALRLANDTEYGLVAFVYTRDLQRALRVAEGLETGMVGLNQGMVSNAAAPFGGIKASGFGREGGREGIGEYLETKYVAVKTDA
jgi:succinate-semialdehyde dehydrogenase/glutarate-semialdehyde dehydrogenase